MNIDKFLSHFQPNGLMVFGLLLVFGVLGGMIANRFKWLPTITAFMLLGLLIGPHGLQLVNAGMMKDAMVLIDIALGLILYKLGNMLHPKAMLRSRRMITQAVTESTLTFIFVFALVIALGYDGILAAFIGAIAVSSSPAVLVHVSEEMDAKGPVTERAKSLVAMNNLFSFLIFSLALPFAMFRENDSIVAVLLLPLYKMVGAVAIGVGAGWLATRVARMLHKRDEHYRFAIVVGSVMLTLGVAEMMHASALFAPLILGIATRWFETSKHNLSRVGLGEGGDLFFIVLFVMAGAKLDPRGIVEAGIVPVLLVIVRICGKFAGVFITSVYAGFTKLQATGVGLLLIPMAGMAIGLAATTTTLVPELGVKITTIVFTVVALFETIGPFAAAHAFRMCGEANEDDGEITASPPPPRGGNNRPAAAAGQKG